jgi:hypothetical protein
MRRRSAKLRADGAMNLHQVLNREIPRSAAVSR